MHKLFLLLSLLVPLGRSHWLYGKYRTNIPAPKPKKILSMEFTATKSPFFMKDSGASLDMKSFRMTDSDIIMNCNVGLRKPCGTDNERDCHRWKCCWDPNARIKCSKSYFIITDPRVCGRAEGPLFPGTSNEIAERPRPMYDLENNFLEIIIMKVAGATNQQIISRIVNGLPTTTKDWPWIARLYERNDPSTTICGGAIIATQWILTAAHCLTTLDPSIYGVNVGDTDSSITEPEQQNFDAQLLIRHPGYQSLRYVNDIALIKLNRKMTYSDYVIPICLPSQGLELASDYDVYFAGWGYTVPNDPTSVSNTLNVGGGKSILDSVCEVVVPTKLPGEAKLCLTTGSGLSDACNGDSGGPATALINEKFYLVGLTSYSDNTNCNSGTPGVYTKVSAFKDWILANIGA